MNFSDDAQSWDICVIDVRACVRSPAFMTQCNICVLRTDITHSLYPNQRREKQHKKNNFVHWWFRMKERGESRRVKIYLCIKDKWSKLMIIIWICISSHFLKPHHPCIIIGFWYVKTSTPANWTNHFPFSYVFHVIFFMSSNLAYVPKLNDLSVAVDILLLFVVWSCFSFDLFD